MGHYILDKSISRVSIPLHAPPGVPFTSTSYFSVVERKIRRRKRILLKLEFQILMKNNNNNNNDLVRAGDPNQ